MAQSTGSRVRAVVFCCLSLLWVSIGGEFVNYLGAEGAGYTVLWAMLAGMVAWALAEGLAPRAAGLLRRWLYLAAVPFTFLLNFYQWPVYGAAVAVFGLLAGAVFSATLCGFGQSFSGKYRYTKMSAALGCFFCGVGVYLLLSEPLLNAFFEKALLAGSGEEEASAYAFSAAGLVIHGAMAAIALLLFFLYQKPAEKTGAPSAPPRAFANLPASRGLLVAIGVGIVVFSCALSTLNKAYLNVTDRQDELLYYIFIFARLARLLLVTFYGWLIDTRRLRLLIGVPLVLILLCGSIPLLFTGQAASAIVFFLAIMGGSSFTYLLMFLPLTVAPQTRRPPLVACVGAVVYMLSTVTLDVNIVKYGVGPFLFAHKEFLFVGVVLCAVPMFFLLMEFFVRQRGLELEARFEAAAAAGDIPPAPEEAPAGPAAAPAAQPAEDLGRIADLYLLTRRERELLPYLLSPLTAEEIAKENFISVNTARTHISNILGKMRAASRRELQKLAGRELLAGEGLGQ